MYARFRWVACQLDYLCQLSTDGACRKALYTLPPTLFETYERILTRVNETCEENQLLVERVLRWTVCAKEPLSTEALLEVLAIGEEHIRLDREFITNEEKILELCSSLIRRTPSSSGFELAHFTVKEFLLAIDPAKKDSFSRYHIKSDKDEVQLASDCLRYLCFEDFEAVRCNDKESLYQQLEHFSFYSYAALHWDDHTHTHLKHNDLISQVQMFFAPLKTDQFICWSQYYYYWNFKGEDLDDDQQADTSNTTPLHWASCLAIPEICEWLIEEGCEVDKGSGLGSPLRCAILGIGCFTSHWPFIETEPYRQRTIARTETINTLLSAGADVHTKPHPESNHSLLFLAITQEPELVGPLLAAGALIDGEVLERMTSVQDFEALYLVSEKNLCDEIRPKYLELILNLKKNDDENVTTLLENRRDQEDENDQLLAAKTTLHEAAVWGKAKTLKNLVQRPDLDLNSTFGSDASTALHLASLNGHYEAVNILVGKGSKLNQRDKDGNTPAHYATLGGNLKVLKYLHENGADLHEINKCGFAPLHIAAQGSNLKVLQHLMQISQDYLLSRTVDGRIPLMYAAETGSLDVADLIMDKSNKSDLLARSQDGRTCLHFAAMSFEDGMLDLFINKGIPMDVKSDDGSTALNSSINNIGGYDGFDLLLQNGASLTIPTNDGTLPIHQICKDPWPISVSRLEMLFRFAGKDVTYLNTKTHSGINSLQLLVSRHILSRSSFEMIKTLTNQKEVDVDCLNDSHETPLITLARRWGSGEDYLLASMGCLLARGANSNATCQDSRTALHYIFSAPYSPTTSTGAHLLLDHDARLDIQDKYGKTVIDFVFNLWENELIKSHDIGDATKITKTIIEMMSTDKLQKPLDNGSLPLQVAILARNETLINSLLDRNVGTNQAMGSVCAYGCDPVTAKKFISSSTNLLKLNESGLGPIHIASENGQDGIVEELLFAKVDVDTPTSQGETPLHRACLRGQLSTADLLLKHGANAFAKDRHGASIAHNSALSNSESICRLIWKRGVPWTDGATFILGNFRFQSVLPLHLASVHGHISVTEFLLKNQLVPDIDIIADQKYSLTPLHLACWNNAVDTAKLLLFNGANVNIVEGYCKYTPLHFTALHEVILGEESVIATLLVHDPDLEQLDHRGLSPEANALAMGNKEVVQMIREHCEKIGMLLVEILSRSIRDSTNPMKNIKIS